ncbi:15936_t:CDS:1, partial [Gigaspora rosea]
LEQGETQNDKELNLAVKLAILLALFKSLASTYDEDYISSSLIKESIFRYLNTLQPTDPLRKESEDLINNLSRNTANRYNQ